MWNTQYDVTYPADANEIDWSYEQGNELRDWSLQELKQYYTNLVSYYTKGGFVDQYGNVIKSPYNFNIPYWEVLNEVESEHQMSVEYYTQIYDAIVSGILSVQPNMKFVGMALCCPSSDKNWFTYFLDSANHAPNIPLDYISFHFYASCGNRTDESEYATFFPQADKFMEKIAIPAMQVRDKLSPSTKIDLDEIGVILPDDNGEFPVAIPSSYWHAAGAMYAYIVGKLSLVGVDVLGESQLVGFPTQFPSVTELYWTDGTPTARYWILQMLIDNIHLGDKFVQTNTTNNEYVFASAFISSNTKKLMIVNKLNEDIQLFFPDFTGGTIIYLDSSMGSFPPITTTLAEGDIYLGGWAVAFIEYA